MEKCEKLERDQKNETRIGEKRMGKEEGKYFYCAIMCNEEKHFGKIGMNDGEVYAMPYRDIAAVVSDSSIIDYELTEDNTKRHEDVIRQVMNEHSVVPTEFGTMTKNEVILKRLLKKAYEPIRECLKIVDNMAELGVKTVLTENSAFASASAGSLTSWTIASRSSPPTVIENAAPQPFRRSL